MPHLPRHRLWVANLSPGRLVLSGDSAHYLRVVLRLSAGDQVALMSGNGQVATANLMLLQRDSAELEVGEITPAPKVRLELTVAVPTPKGERADWLVEKLTELGVARIVWMITARSVVVAKQGTQRAERWSRIAQAAAKQSGSARTPTIEGPLALDAILGYQAATRYIGARGGVPLVHELALAPPAATSLLLIGPEGGFADDELERAQQSGVVAVGLGVYTLRMETAALAGASMLLCDLGDANMAASREREAS